MKSPMALYLLLLAFLVLSCCSAERKLYVVYMGDRPQIHSSVSSTHLSMLQTVLGSFSSAEESLVYSYGRSFDGFAAKLTEEEAATIAEMKGVVSVTPNRTFKLHTTRSWDFMGFSEGKLGAGLEGNVIIGLLDTGVWPEHPSFNDTGYSTPPSKWKGACQTTNFTCNNKLIGARFYNTEKNFSADVPSPRDVEGHGTHTASIAAGGEIVGASFLGLAEGVARGGVPNARIAAYKVCWLNGCDSADILKAFDDAIADGVDVISVSLGFDYPLYYFEDPIAIGSFHAMKNGILTSNSAGNDGPDPVTVSNVAPWTMTVAASSIDRKFVTQLALGNGQVFTGIAINSFDLKGKSYPLIWGGDAANYTFGYGQDYAGACEPDAMNLDEVGGKIVLCEGLADGSTILLANGIGTVMVNADATDFDYAFSFPLPATLINPDDGEKVMDYIKSTKFPIASILVGETWKDAMAPKVASFSSRGPNAISPDILKPDVSAPGVDILAGWSPVAPPSSVYSQDTRSLYFNIVSGTSMSCPHASAAAAYVKAAHPDWSPSAIKSAIMTTAYIMDPKKNTDLEFSYGSGHINPTAAVDPGLVFNASETDYVDFLCEQGYNTSMVRVVSGDDSACTNSTPGRAWDLNYPSFSLYVNDGDKVNGAFNRRVTNVGTANSSYTATMYMPALINVTVEPSVLAFSSIGDTKSFTVKVTGRAIAQQPILSGAITWSDGKHEVRTPLVVYNYIPGAPVYVGYADPSLKDRKLEGSYMDQWSGIM